MKKINFYLATVLLALSMLLVSASAVSAQDWEKMNPGGIETLADTALLRAVVVTLDPGAKIGPMTHPAYFAYVLTGGMIKVYHEKGEPSVIDFKTGMYVYSGPEGPHHTENIGEEPVKFLLVELKEHPYQAPENKKE